MGSYWRYLNVSVTRFLRKIYLEMVRFFFKRKKDIHEFDLSNLLVSGKIIQKEVHQCNILFCDINL